MLPGCASNRRHDWSVFFLKNIICMVSTWSHHPCIVPNSTGQHQQNRHFLTAVYRCKMRQWCKNTHSFCLIIFDTFSIELLAANGACKNQIICKIDSNINNSLIPNTILCQCRRHYSAAHKTALNNVFLVTLPPWEAAYLFICSYHTACDNNSELGKTRLDYQFTFGKSVNSSMHWHLARRSLL